MTVGNSILRKSVSGVGFLAAGLLSVLDSTPAVEISRVGQWVSPSCGGVSAIAVSGTYAYLQSEFGLEVLDFSNPANPTVVGATVLLGGRNAKRVKPLHCLFL